MHVLKAIAAAGAIAAAALGLSQGSASATPYRAGAMPAAEADGGSITPVYHRGRPHFVERRFYRPARPEFRRFRRGPRVVCRVQIRTVRTGYGRVIRRPVEICTRRF